MSATTPSTEVTFKTCNICGLELQLSCFYAHPTNPDRLAYKCKECSRRLNRENHEKNGNQIRRKQHYAYKTDHNARRTEMLEYQKRYRRTFKEKVLAYARSIREDGRAFVNLKIANYRRTPTGRYKANLKQQKRERAIVGTMTFSEWLEVLNRYGRCLRCGMAHPDVEITIDHIIPVSKGGMHTKDNVQPLCRNCNSWKQAKIIDFRPAA